MNILHEMLSSSLLQRVGWVLLHSLWQFSLIAIVLAVLLETLQRRSPATRYIVCCVALATTLLAAGITFSFTIDMPVGDIASVEHEAIPIVTLPDGPQEATDAVAPRDFTQTLPPSFQATEATPPIALSPEPTPVEIERQAKNIPEETPADTPPIADQISTALQPWLPGASLVWLCGVLLLSLWNAGGWLGVVRLRRIGNEPVAQEIKERVEALAIELRLRQSLRVLQSTLVEVPVIIGWWRPVLLMPVGIVTGLTPQQLDALLAHELTHVRRYDYLVNLVQTLIETVLFYHPAIWWMSRKIRAEREYCCDDAAIRVCGDNVEYANVLASFEQMRSAPRPAVAATDGNTLSRVRRILGANTPTRRLTKSLAGSLAFIAIITSSIIYFLQTGADVKQAAAAESPAAGTFVKAEITQSFDADGNFIEKARLLSITDGAVLKKLKTHFPNVDTGKKSDIAGGWESSAIVLFHRQDGKIVRVSTNFEDWSEGQGDWSVKGDLAELLEKQIVKQKQDKPSRDFGSIQWMRSGIRQEGQLELHDDGTFVFIETRHIATGPDPHFKKEQPASDSGEQGQPTAEPEPLEPLPPEAFIFRDVKTTRTGKWRLLHPKLQLFSLDEKDTSSGVRLYRTSGVKPQWRFEKVLLTDKVSQFARHNWLRATPKTLAVLSALAPFPNEIPLTNLPKSKTEYTKLSQDVPHETIARLTKIIPDGWSLFAAGDRVMLTHDHPIEVEYFYPSSPISTVAEAWNDISEERINIQLQFFPRLTPQQRLTRVKQLQDQIDALVKQMVPFQDPPGRKPSAWGYLPSNDQQRKLLDRYVDATRTRNALPDYYDTHSSVEMDRSLPEYNYLTNQQVDKQLHDLVITLKGLFHTYSATDSRAVSDAQQALIIAAIQTPSLQSGVGQATVGIDLSKHLELSDQQKDLDAFTKDHRYFDRDVQSLVELKKTWALGALLNHKNADAKILAARGLLNLADPLCVPVLLAAAKRNNYIVSGSESATIHMIYRSTLKEALEKITDQQLTPAGLRVTIYPGTRAGKTIRSEDEPSYFKEHVDFNKVQLWLQTHQRNPQTSWLTPSQSQALPQLVSDADGIVLIEQLSGRPAKIMKTYKGSYKPGKLTDHLQRILTSHPGDLEGPRWFLFLREESTDSFLRVAPAVTNANHWLIAATPLLTASIEQLIPVPRFWSRPVQSVSMGVRARHPIVTEPEQLVLEIALRTGKRSELWNHRYHIYDYWPFTIFEVTAPDGSSFILAKPEGAIKESDHPGKQILQPGGHYIHSFHLSDWGVYAVGKPIHWQADQQARQKANAQAFAKPGKYTIRAIYQVKHRRGDAHFMGRLVSPTIVVRVAAAQKRNEKQAPPNNAITPTEEKVTAIDGLNVSLAPGKPQFNPTEPVFVKVAVTNTAATNRYLGISPSAGKHDDGQDTTTVDINGQRRKIGGIPGYVHVRGDVGWNVRLGSNGYSDRYEGAVEIKPGAKATFRVILPAFGDNMNRPTGRLAVSSRFAVARKADGPRLYRFGPKSVVLVVDQEKLAQGVATLQEALAGKATKGGEIENAIRAIADNPAPEHVKLVAKVVGHRWPGREHIQWNLWYAASKYVDPAIYKMAVAEASRPKLNVGVASLVYKTIYRNRQYFKRSDALQIVKNPQLQNADFASTNSNGFWPTILLATVAQQQDIPLLGNLCGKYIPPRIGHDLTHATMPNRGIEPIHAAFMRHPDASQVALRKVLGQGRVPGKFAPWAHEFSIGLVPKSLVMMARWSAELKDTEAIPLLEHYAKTDLVRVSNSMQTEAPKLIAAIDGPAAIKSLRRIGPRGTRERAKLGDPVAIDALLAQARALYGSRDDDTGEAHSTFALVFSIMNPNQKVTFQDVHDGVPVELQWKQRRTTFAKAFATKYGFDPDGDEVEKRAEIPAHLKQWPGLSDRIDGKIVDASPEDVKVAKGYAAFAPKGASQKGRRVTIMTARKEYAVGEEVRVLHVLEAVDPGDEVYVMGPKAIYDEYLDGTRVTKDAPGLSNYDGRVLKSPAVDYNYVITKYRFDEPGEHTIQWKTAGPFDGGKLESNRLKITVVQPITDVRLSLRSDAESWNIDDTPTFKIDIHNNGPKTWALPPSQPLYEIEVDGTWYQWTGPISVTSPLVKPGKGLTDIPLKADGKFFQRIMQAPKDTKLIPLKFPLGRHTIRVACSPDPEDATKTERVRVVSNRVNIDIALSEKDILSAVKKQLLLESVPTIVKKAKRPELQLPFLRKKYGETEIWEVAVGIKPPSKLDPPIKGMHAFVGSQGEILKLQTTPSARLPIKSETAEQSLTSRGYTLCALPNKYQLPLKKLLHQRQDHSFWAGDRKGKQQMEVFFATREGKKGIICLFLLRGYQHMITPPPMIVDGKAKESPSSIIDIAWMIDYNLDTKQWGGRGSFPDGED